MEGLAGLAGGFDGLRERLLPHPPLEVLPVGRLVLHQVLESLAQLFVGKVNGIFFYKEKQEKKLCLSNHVISESVFLKGFE